MFILIFVSAVEVCASKKTLSYSSFVLWLASKGLICHGNRRNGLNSLLLISRILLCFVLLAQLVRGRLSDVGEE